MKFHALLFTAFFVATTALAGTSPPWPKAVGAHLTFKTVAAANLPDGVALYDKGDQTPEERAKRSVGIAHVDLNGDGVPELVVAADEGGSAGGYYDVYQRRHGQYQNIGWLGAGGAPMLLSRHNGFYQLEVWSRGGSQDRVRQLFRYSHGAYHCIRIDDFHIGEYVGTRKPDA